jgi:hypothetical protein
MATKIFWLPKRWRGGGHVKSFLKKESSPPWPYDQKNSITIHWLGCVRCQSKNSAAIQHIPIVQWRLEMGARHMFLESLYWRLSKNIWHAPLLCDQNVLVTINCCLCTLQWPKNFSHHRVSNWKFSIITSLVINFLSHHKIGDCNPFSVTICNGGNPSVNKYFLTFVLMNVTNMLGWTSTWCLMQNGRVTLVLTTLLSDCYD